MLDHPTIPMPAVTVSRAAVRALRRKSADDRRRADDLRLAGMGSALSRTDALAVVARMSARGDRQTVGESRAVRELMRRHNLTGPMIDHEQRRTR